MAVTIRYRMWNEAYQIEKQNSDFRPMCMWSQSQLMHNDRLLSVYRWCDTKGTVHKYHNGASFTDGMFALRRNHEQQAT